MRKPRDFDAEMKVLGERARQLKERKVQQLGELVVACRADALPIELLAGALIDAVDTNDPAILEGWRARGATFFQRPARRTSGSAGSDAGHRPASDGGAQQAAGKTSA